MTEKAASCAGIPTYQSRVPDFGRQLKTSNSFCFSFFFFLSSIFLIENSFFHKLYSNYGCPSRNASQVLPNNFTVRSRGHIEMAGATVGKDKACLVFLLNPEAEGRWITDSNCQLHPYPLSKSRCLNEKLRFYGELGIMVSWLLSLPPIG